MLPLGRAKSARAKRGNEAQQLEGNVVLPTEAEAHLLAIGAPRMVVWRGWFGWSAGEGVGLFEE